MPGVDDVIAWKSPILNELRKFGFIDKGCHISELACLRWLEKIQNADRNFENEYRQEIILVEVKPSSKSGLSSSPSKGINQLFRVMSEQTAKELYICFPVISTDVEEVKDGIRKFCQTEQNPKVGAILFSECELNIDKSEAFCDKERHSVIKEYENNLKRVLINNLYFGEILEMIKELGIDTQHKGFEEVRDSFYNEIDKIHVGTILERIGKAKAHSDDAVIAI